MSSDELKAKGNAAFSAGQFEEAVKLFDEAIAVDGENHVLYSNKSAALASMGKYEEALEAANKVTSLKPDWPKGYSRVGAALYGLERWDEAVESYSKGLEIDPENAQMKQGLEDAKRARGGGSGLGQLFSRPEVLSRLASDPRTSALMGQPDFMSMMKSIEENPQNMQQYMQDERFKLLMEVALGVSMHMPGESETPAHEKAPGHGDDSEMQDSKGEKRTEEASAAEDEPEDKKRAYEEKEEGNKAYKAKRFDDAIQHYNAAIDLYDQDISFITNKAAVKFEMGKYEECIKDCEDAIEKGRELRADYKLIARAMTRIGNALVKLGKLEEAVSIYNRSLTEHRNADTLKRLNETEKAIKDAKEAAYIDLELCSEEKEKGNAAFKEQNYPEAVKHYSEALKRGPPSVNQEAYKLFSNRAACYTKLGAWNEGLKDAEKCIELAPEFPKGYSRKGHLQFFMKEYSKAMTTYEEGLKQDPENMELKDGLRRCVQAINSLNSGEMTDEERRQRQERAMADPEIQGILSDPVMRNVLRDMEENPAAAQKHLSHPDIAKKFEKLVASGIVQVK